MAAAFALHGWWRTS
ncbi:trp operon leader peptide [Salmonella enterica subsp. enterica serovar Typhimurium]|nr:trp operon leader peptide [Salmonella enterica subsp. enterica serovar Typhimurium]EGG4117309.1 trp operon leader peptide [Salmonella enterica]EGG4131111.1 trp operon leader peptide [Salmonella enterica]